MNPEETNEKPEEEPTIETMETDIEVKQYIEETALTINTEDRSAKQTPSEYTSPCSSRSSTPPISESKLFQSSDVTSVSLSSDNILDNSMEKSDLKPTTTTTKDLGSTLSDSSEEEDNNDVPEPVCSILSQLDSQPR